MDGLRPDVELPNKMASLDIMELDNTNIESASEKQTLCPEVPKETRVLRKRRTLTTTETNKPSNRRVSMKPRKRIVMDDASPKRIEALYLNKKVKTVSQTLETIYEEPKTESVEAQNLMGGRKVKRLLTFQLGSQYSKEKIKKRRAKIKKLLGNKNFLNRKKIPMQMFLQNIECLNLDEEVETSDGTS